MMSSLICGLRFSHPRKVSSPMRVTVFGMLMIVMELHPLKALSPMFVTLYGMLMLVRDLHSKNAQSSILVTLSGMLMLVREWHSEKAFFPILFTLLGMLYVLLPPIYAIMIVLSSVKVFVTHCISVDFIPNGRKVMALIL